MPKIPQIRGINDSSMMEGPPTFNNKSLHRTSNVPIHMVEYNPEYSKSPIASHMMQRNTQHPTSRNYRRDERNQYPQYGHDQDYRFDKENSKSHYDWKKILCWLGVILAIVALAVGIYFLIDHLLGKNDSQPYVAQAQIQDGAYYDGIYSLPQQNRGYYSGIAPTQTPPEPITSLYGKQYSPQTSVSSSSNMRTQSQQVYTKPLSFQTSTEKSYKQQSTYPAPKYSASTQPRFDSNPYYYSSPEPYTRPSSVYENSVQPIDVYAGQHK